MSYQAGANVAPKGGLLATLFNGVPAPKGKRGKGGKQAAKKQKPAPTLFSQIAGRQQ